MAAHVKFGLGLEIEVSREDYGHLESQAGHALLPSRART
jgi:hypothetical protein